MKKNVLALSIAMHYALPPDEPRVFGLSEAGGLLLIPYFTHDAKRYGPPPRRKWPRK